MFEHLVLRGDKAEVLWGYRSAAECKAWWITKARDPKTKQMRWSLSATVTRTEAFMLRQTPLLFAAPRPKNGFWMWPVLEVQAKGSSLRAKLGAVEF